jgi:hypothetical protein
MFTATLADAAASTDFADDNSAADSATESCPVADSPAHGAAHPPEAVRHLLFGNAATVQATIKHLHKLRYAEANDWSEPMATGRPNEVRRPSGPWEMRPGNSSKAGLWVESKTRRLR